jgi:membrane protein insertase Oxa1/YidC/SpoIIIJ
MPATPPSSGSGDRSADQAAQVSKQMMTIMPLMFGFFSLSFASGLSIYFIASNLIGIGQYAMMGKITLFNRHPAEKEKRAEADLVLDVKEKPKRGEIVPPPQVKARRTGIYDSRAERANKLKSKAKG